jgi:hypothetical protein
MFTVTGGNHEKDFDAGEWSQLTTRAIRETADASQSRARNPKALAALGSNSIRVRENHAQAELPQSMTGREFKS